MLKSQLIKALAQFPDDAPILAYCEHRTLDELTSLCPNGDAVQLNTLGAMRAMNNESNYQSPAEIEQMRIEPSVKIPLGVLRARLKELPRDREIVTFCKISLRGYEAALILNTAGFEHVKVMDGGIVMWPYEKIN